MEKHDQLWNDINTLLSMLRSGKVVELVEDRYARFKNKAPAELLEQQIAILQKQLDEAE